MKQAKQRINKLICKILTVILLVTAIGPATAVLAQSNEQQVLLASSLDVIEVEPELLPFEYDPDITMLNDELVIFRGSSPAQLNALLQVTDVVLETPGNLGIFAHHSPFVIPEGRTLTVVTAFNISGNAEVAIAGTIIVAYGGRINIQGGLGGTLRILSSGTLINYGQVEGVTNSFVINQGRIVNNNRFEIRANTTLHNTGVIEGTTPLNIHRNAIIINEEQTVTLFFMGNGGMPYVTELVRTAGSTIGELPVAPIRLNHAFIGWYDSPVLAEATAITVDTIVPDANVSFYALWRELGVFPYMFHFIIQAGQGGQIIQGSEGYFFYGNRIGIEAQANDGFAFYRWETSHGGHFEFNNTVSSNFFIMPNSSTVVTAIFTPIGDNNYTSPVIIFESSEIHQNFLQTTESEILIRGFVHAQTIISNVSAVVDSIATNSITALDVDGLINFEIYVPLGIGQNLVTVEAVDMWGNVGSEVLYIDRLSTIIDIASHVMTSPIEEIEIVINSILEVNTIDEVVYLSMLAGSPLVNAIINGTFLINDVYWLPSSPHLVTGFVGELISFSSGSNPLYYVLGFTTPSLTDLFADSVRMDFSGGVDEYNPIAFILMPDGTQIVPDEFGDLNFNELAFIEPHDLLTRPGFQWLSLLASIEVDASGSSVMLNIDNAIIYDADGDLSTSFDQMRLNGRFGFEDIYHVGGIEWHGSFLPQQIMSKTSGTKVFEVSLSFPEVVRYYYGGDGQKRRRPIEASRFLENLPLYFSNKSKISKLNLAVQGVSFSNALVLATVGVRIKPFSVRYYSRIYTLAKESVAVPIEPILVLSLILHVDGSLSVTGSISYQQHVFIEQGFNVQRRDFVGKHGSLYDNTGQRGYDLPFNRRLEIFDTSQTTSRTEFRGEGEATFEFGAGINAGLMISGFIPANIRAVGFFGMYLLADGSLVIENERSNLTDDVESSFDWNGYIEFTVGVGVRISGGIRIIVGNSERDRIDSEGNTLPAGLNFGIAEGFSWQHWLLNLGASTGRIYGVVTAEENGLPLQGVRVSVERLDAIVGNTIWPVYTDEYGKFEFRNILRGEYEVMFEKDGFAIHIEDEIVMDRNRHELNVPLSPSSPADIVIIMDESFGFFDQRDLLLTLMPLLHEYDRVSIHSIREFEVIRHSRFINSNTSIAQATSILQTIPVTSTSINRGLFTSVVVGLFEFIDSYDDRPRIILLLSTGHETQANLNVGVNPPIHVLADLLNVRINTVFVPNHSLGTTNVNIAEGRLITLSEQTGGRFSSGIDYDYFVYQVRSALNISRIPRDVQLSRSFAFTDQIFLMFLELFEYITSNHIQVVDANY